MVIKSKNACKYVLFFIFSYGNTKRYVFLYIFEKLSRMQLKLSIPFFFLVLNIQNI